MVRDFIVLLKNCWFCEKNLREEVSKWIYGIFLNEKFLKGYKQKRK